MKKILAISLALLLLLGAGAVSAAAAPAPPQPAALLPQVAGDTVEITLAPADILVTRDYDDEAEWWFWSQPDLSGVEVSVNGKNIGSAALSYDAHIAAADNSPALGKVVWEMYADQWSEEYGWRPWRAGENAVSLVVYAYECTKFNPQFEEGGVEYGWFDTETLFYARCLITVTGVDNMPLLPGYDLDNVIGLSMGSEYPFTFTFGEDESWGRQLFSFTAPQDGYYRLSSGGARNGGTYYSVEGDVLEVPGLYLQGYVLDADGYDIELGYRWRAWPNFMRSGWLAAGDYFLLVEGWGEEGVITIKAEQYEPGEAQYRVTVNYRDYINLDSVFNGTGRCWDDIWDIEHDWTVVGGWSEPYGNARGTGYMDVFFYDGSTTRVEVTVRYTAAQILCMVFLGGFIWMPYISIGPFSLARELRSLLDYGVVNALRDLLADWFYALYLWVRPW